MSTTYLGKIVEQIKPEKVVKYNLDGKNYQIHYIDDSKLKKKDFSLFGYVYQGKIFITNKLTPKIERALIRHEVYHVNDKQIWLGRYGKEIRANLHTLIRDPLGFAATLLSSINVSRLKTYWRLYVYPRNLN